MAGEGGKEVCGPTRVSYSSFFCEGANMEAGDTILGKVT